MTTVFLAGSRNLSHLNDEVRQRLENILRQHFRIVVGDANGADKALQQYLVETGYGDVLVYCSGTTCRNNLGHWQTVNVHVDFPAKGRQFYQQKDKKMADDADYGFMLWDGKSPGTLNNVLELLKRHKQVLVYVSSDRTFYTVNDVSDARRLLTRCDEQSISAIQKKIDLKKTLQELEGSLQSSLGL